MLQLFNKLALVKHIRIHRRKAVFNIDTELITRQIPQMTTARHDAVVAAQEPFNRLGLSR